MGIITVPIRGMHCASCEILIGEELKKLPHVAKAVVSLKKATATIHYSNERPTDAEIAQAVHAAGYEVGEKKRLPWISRDWRDYKDLARAAIILFVLYWIAQRLGLFDLAVNTEKDGLLIALLVGLVAGVSTCMALIGGLVLSLSARHAELHPEATAIQKFRPHLYFNLGRIVGYAFLGGIIGMIGKAFQPTTGMLGVMTMVVGGVMIFLGLKLVEVFPALRDKTITLPSGIAQLFGLHKEVKEYSHKTASIMGALTFFLPCGFTQAMQIYAISTGSFTQGAVIMGLFALGTAPGLLGVGGLTAALKGKKARTFFMGAGLAVILLGWFNIANGSRLLSGDGGKGTTNPVVTEDAQEVKMVQGANGYLPSVFTVQKGKPVKWVIDSRSSFSCAASLVVPSLGISKTLKKGENIITFTPTKVGTIPFSCSMGMYRGKFIVVDENGKTSSALPTDSSSSANLATATTGSSCGGGCGGCGGGSRASVTPNVGAVESTESEQVIKTIYTYNKDIAPNTFTVKAGEPVRLEIKAKESGRGCMSSIMVPGLYDEPQYLESGTTVVMTFTPTKAGEYPITCAMGVPRGVIKVIT
ncbi:MAG: hypothetical protein A3J66_02410 [Candidatus Magasanikbacteria bacterium RIFCSPHIGHO2_02_FULL_47_14]|uniref:HMA domain-containing protein n=1 Tax=Candidatus Magasanikbacteria bacterium RIFCSPHIGHO2_02_FULL_47_14 TaxID=1798680 RepID=A0A1F6M1E9_9BACT|nr:MAG: hypothetical protein A3J66_02410 [Candidatus Magasanikbacteria bacterium RIFCSPHIGHO2_02_FULL_47_14]